MCNLQSVLGVVRSLIRPIVGRSSFVHKPVELMRECALLVGDGLSSRFRSRRRPRLTPRKSQVGGERERESYRMWEMNNRMSPLQPLQIGSNTACRVSCVCSSSLRASKQVRLGAITCHTEVRCGEGANEDV